MTSLYQISKDYQAVAEMEDMAPEAIRDTLEAIGGEFEDKAVNLIKHTFNVKGDVAQIDAEIDRLKNIKRMKSSVIENLHDYLKVNMTACGITKIEHPLFKITLIKPRKMVNITDDHAIPDEYTDVETVIKPKKAEILKDLKEGKTIPGAEMVDSEPGLMIK